MAGETEDCISLQADHLPTGSISFGRFALETLSWQRKSSFCHNRYLEEVEKYSTPGSVTQKRAILEAHFKKKPLCPQYSLQGKSVSGCQASINGSKSCSNEYKDDEIKPQFCWYDDSPSCSDGHEDLVSELVILDKKGDHDRKSEDQIPDKDVISERELENRNSEDQISDKDVISEHEPENKAVIMEELLDNKEATGVEEVKTCVESKCSEVDSKKMVNLKKNTPASSQKVKEANEHKFVNSKQKGASASGNARKSTSERNHASSGKMISRAVKNKEQESIAKSKSVEQEPIRMPRPRSAVSRNPKSEVFASMEAKDRRENMRSEATNGKKSIKATKSIPRPHSTSGRNEVDEHKSLNRPKHAYVYKEEPRQSGSVFSLKSDERAEQRKEYYIKLEEKLQAKEVEMSKIQAKTKEQTEAAIKQFRRSLNFKANPMPSFYSEAVPKSSERKKKPAVVATESKAKSEALSKAPNQRAPSITTGKVQKKCTAVNNSSSDKGDALNVVKRGVRSGN